MSNMKVARIAGLCAAVWCCAFAQRPTIPDHIAQNGGRPVSLPILRDTQPVSVRDLAAADLVVLGELVPWLRFRTIRLLADECSRRR